MTEPKKKKSNSPAWAVIRIPRALYDRIVAGQGTTQHETITRAFDAWEDPKGERRVRELRAELAKLKRLHEAALAMIEELRTKAERAKEMRALPRLPAQVTGGFRFSEPNGAAPQLPIFGKGVKK